MNQIPRPREDIKAGTQAAERSVTAQAEAGMDADTIAGQQDDATARMLTDVRTRGRQDFARGWEVGKRGIYERTARREQELEERGTPEPPWGVY
ncbi:MAG: hypothetical protein ACR2FU_09050 [Streptosporangiaceae bacterium]